MIENIIRYSIYTVLCSGMFLLLYRCLVSRKASYNFCCWYLIAAMILSAVIPSLKVPLYNNLDDLIWTSEMQVMHSWPAGLAAQTNAEKKAGVGADGNTALQQPGSVRSEELSEIPTSRTDSNSSSHTRNEKWLFALIAVYVVGLLLFIGTTVFSIVSILRKKRRSVLTDMDGFILAENDGVTSPFTFMRTIFVRGGSEGNEYRQVISHESSHVRHHHSYQKMVMSAVRSIMWFNPFVWRAEKRLDEVQEWQADHDALSDGYRLEDYRDTVLRQLFGLNPLAASGINSSFTKNRLLKMKQKESTGHNLSVAAAVLALTVGLFLCFGCVEKKSENKLASQKDLEYYERDDRIIFNTDRFFDDNEPFSGHLQIIEGPDMFGDIGKGIEIYESHSRNGWPVYVAANGYKLADLPTSTDLKWVKKNTRIFIGGKRSTFEEFISLQPEEYTAILYYRCKSDKKLSFVYVLTGTNNCTMSNYQTVIDWPGADLEDIDICGGYGYRQDFFNYATWEFNAAAPDAQYAIDGRIVSFQEFQNIIQNPRHKPTPVIFRNEFAKKRFGEDVQEVVELRSDHITLVRIDENPHSRSLTVKVDNKPCELSSLAETLTGLVPEDIGNEFRIVNILIDQSEGRIDDVTVQDIVSNYIPWNNPRLVFVVTRFRAQTAHIGNNIINFSCTRRAPERIHAPQ